MDFKKLFILLFFASMSFANFNTTNTTNITLSHTYDTPDFQNYMSTFYGDWGQYILAILALGFSFMFSNSYSQTLVMTGVGWVLIGFFTGASVMFIGGAVMLIIGSILKYVIG